MFEFNRSPVTLCLCLTALLFTAIYGSFVTESPVLLAADKFVCVPRSTSGIMDSRATSQSLGGWGTSGSSIVSSLVWNVPTAPRDKRPFNSRANTSSNTSINYDFASAAERCPTPIIPHGHHIRSLFMPAFRLSQRTDGKGGVGYGGISPFMAWIDSVLSLGRGRHKRRVSGSGCRLNKKLVLSNEDAATIGPTIRSLSERAEGFSERFLSYFIDYVWSPFTIVASAVFSLCVIFPLKYLGSAFIALTPAEFFLSLFLMLGSGSALEVRLGSPRFTSMLILLAVGGGLLYLCAAGLVTVLSTALLKSPHRYSTGDAARTPAMLNCDRVFVADLARSDSVSGWWLEVLGVLRRPLSLATSDSSDSSTACGDLMLGGEELFPYDPSFLLSLAAQLSRVFIDITSMLEVYVSSYSVSEADGRMMAVNVFTTEWLLVPTLAPLALVLHAIYRLLTVTVVVVGGGVGGARLTRPRQSRAKRFFGFGLGARAGSKICGYTKVGSDDEGGPQPESSNIHFKSQEEAHQSASAAGLAVCRNAVTLAVDAPPPPTPHLMYPYVLPAQSSSSSSGAAGSEISRRSSPCVVLDEYGLGLASGNKGGLTAVQPADGSARTQKGKEYCATPSAKERKESDSHRRTGSTSSSLHSLSPARSLSSCGQKPTPKQRAKAVTAAGAAGNKKSVFYCGAVRSYTLFGFIPLADATVGNGGTHPIFQDWQGTVQEVVTRGSERNDNFVDDLLASDLKGEGTFYPPSDHRETSGLNVLVDERRISERREGKEEALSESGSETDDSEADEVAATAAQSNRTSESTDQWAPEKQRPFLLMFGPGSLSTTFLCDVIALQLWLVSGSSTSGWADFVSEPGSSLTESANRSDTVFSFSSFISYVIFSAPLRALIMFFSCRLAPLFWSVFILSHLCCSSRLAKSAKTLFDEAFRRYVEADESQRKINELLFAREVELDKGNRDCEMKRRGKVRRLFSTMAFKIHRGKESLLKKALALANAVRSSVLFILSGGRGKGTNQRWGKLRSPSCEAEGVQNDDYCVHGNSYDDASKGRDPEDNIEMIQGDGSRSGDTAHAQSCPLTAKEALVATLPPCSFSPSSVGISASFVPPLESLALHQLPEDLFLSASVRYIKSVQRAARRRAERQTRRRWLRWQRTNKSFLMQDEKDEERRLTNDATGTYPTRRKGEDRSQQQQRPPQLSDPHAASPYRDPGDPIGSSSKPSTATSAKSTRGRSVSSPTPLLPPRSVGAQRKARRLRERLLADVSEGRWLDRFQRANAWVVYALVRLLMVPLHADAPLQDDEIDVSTPSVHETVPSSTDRGVGNDRRREAPPNLSRTERVSLVLDANREQLSNNGHGSDAVAADGAAQESDCFTTPYRLRPTLVRHEWLGPIRSLALSASAALARMGRTISDRRARVVKANKRLHEEYRRFLNDERHRCLEKREGARGHHGALPLSDGDDENVYNTEDDDDEEDTGDEENYRLTNRFLYMYDPFDSESEEYYGVGEGEEEEDRQRAGGFGVRAARAARNGGSAWPTATSSSSTNRRSQPGRGQSDLRSGGNGEGETLRRPISTLQDMILYLRHRPEFVTVTFVADSLVQTASNPVPLPAHLHEALPRLDHQSSSSSDSSDSSYRYLASATRSREGGRSRGEGRREAAEEDHDEEVDAHSMRELHRDGSNQITRVGRVRGDRGRGIDNSADEEEDTGGLWQASSTISAPMGSTAAVRSSPPSLGTLTPPNERQAVRSVHTASLVPQRVNLTSDDDLTGDQRSSSVFADSRTTCITNGANNNTNTMALQRLLAMGIDESTARSALEASGGSLEEAASALFGD